MLRYGSGRRFEHEPTPSVGTWVRLVAIASLSAAILACGTNESDPNDSEQAAENDSATDIIGVSLDTDVAEVDTDNDAQRDVSGGQTGDGTGVVGVGGEQAAGGCASERANQELDELDAVVGELGFAPSDVLDWVSGGVDTSFSWAPLDDLTTLPESGTGEIQLSFEYDDGDLRLFDGTIGVSPGEEAFGECPPWIEVDVMLELSTPGGALNERVPATLRAAREGVVDVLAVAETSELDGSLELDASEIDDELRSLVVRGTFTDVGSYGRLTAHTEALRLTQLRGSLGAPIAIVGVWPALAECSVLPTAWTEPSNLAIDDDAELNEQRVDEWLEFFDDLPSMTLAWDDGGETTLDLSVEVTTGACYSSGWLEPTERLEYAVEISADTDDGSWAGTYPGFVSLEIGAGGTWAELVVEQTAAFDELASLGVPNAGQAAEELDADYDEMMLSVSLTSRPDGVAGGQVRVDAKREVDCASPEGLVADVSDSFTQDECLASLGERVARAYFGDGAQASSQGVGRVAQ